ncbi:MAG: hypothetical protein R3E96_00700 [Planctomycetota bacterium]
MPAAATMVATTLPPGAMLAAGAPTVITAPPCPLPSQAIDREILAALADGKTRPGPAHDAQKPETVFATQIFLPQVIGLSKDRVPARRGASEQTGREPSSRQAKWQQIAALEPQSG